MNRASFNTFYFWIGCLLGGFILGIVFAWSAKQHKSIVYAEPLRSESPVESIMPSPTIPSPKDDNVTILFTGDVMLGRSVNENIFKNHNPSWPFINTQNDMKAADIVYINLESPLIGSCPLTDKGMVFCGDPTNVEGLVVSGVDVASVANNHATNYGQAGLEQTIGILQANGISVVGTGSPAVVSRKGSNYVFLSFNDVGRYAGINPADIGTITDQIKSVKALGGLIVVGFHWGREYEKEPTARQRSLAHSAIEAGANLVIGSHPHWVQTKEIYMGRPIYYSLGNFVFDQEWSTETKEGLVLRFTYRGLDLVKTEELPVFIEKYGQPQWK